MKLVKARSRVRVTFLLGASDSELDDFDIRSLVRSGLAAARPKGSAWDVRV